jgi:hypothetical protein
MSTVNKDDLRFLLFWDITQRIVVNPYRRFDNVSVRIYHYTLRSISEECKSHLFHGGSLKSHKRRCDKGQWFGAPDSGWYPPEDSVFIFVVNA